MLRSGRHLHQGTIIGLVVAVSAVVTVPSRPAVAEGGFFEFLFGGFRRPPPQPPVDLGRRDDVFRSLFDDRRQHRRPRGQQRETVRGATTGPRAAYCVRLCDGRYFPVQGRRNFSAAQQCSSFCPASTTKVFAGRAIEYATAADGERYADLPNAFRYREQIVPDCTCKTKDTVGVAHVPVTEDPTLRRGDIVATSSGFTVYNGSKRQQEAFTPLEAASVSKSVRNRLADVKIAPRPQADKPRTDDKPISVARSAVRETSGLAPADEGGVSARAR